MRRIVCAFCTAVCVLFTAVSCSRSNDSGVDDLGGGITNNNFSNEVTRVAPLDLIQKMAAGGATIHGGTNPPRVEGFFKTGGMLQLRHSTLGAQDPLINKVHDGFYYKFYQQNGAKLKMNYQNFTMGYGARGVDAVISGEGNKFTIFFINKEMDLTTISGEIFVNDIGELSISNFQQAVINKYEDSYSPVGTVRVFKSETGYADSTREF